MREVASLKQKQLDEMEWAATILRKMWLGAQTKKQYKELKQQHMQAIPSVITIQRYAKGFLTRIRLWREAVRAEEELWGAVEIQRCWRGYIGRVRWENELEKVWRREMAAAKISIYIRGWLARVRVKRIKRQIARTEFERARKRFRAAQKIQACVRGILSRKRVSARKQRFFKAATSIQRYARGHTLRMRLWTQVKQQRATMINAVARGYLVRCRMSHLVAKVIKIQRAYRRWLRRDPVNRAFYLAQCHKRKRKATIIQLYYRQYAERREINRIKVGVPRN